MSRMKYIIIEDSLGEKPYIFSDADQHNHIAAALLFGDNKVVGAGFVSFTQTGLQCWGKSVSLNIASRSIDSDIINRYWA